MTNWKVYNIDFGKVYVIKMNHTDQSGILPELYTSLDLIKEKVWSTFWWCDLKVLRV